MDSGTLQTTATLASPTCPLMNLRCFVELFLSSVSLRLAQNASGRSMLLPELPHLLEQLSWTSSTLQKLKCAPSSCGIFLVANPTLDSGFCYRRWESEAEACSIDLDIRLIQGLKLGGGRFYYFWKHVTVQNRANTGIHHYIASQPNGENSHHYQNPKSAHCRGLTLNSSKSAPIHSSEGRRRWLLLSVPVWPFYCSG